MGTVRRVCRNVNIGARRPWLTLTGAAMQEAAKDFRRLKAYKQLSAFAAALAARKARAASSNEHLVKPRRLRRFSISDAASRFQHQVDIAGRRRLVKLPSGFPLMPNKHNAIAGIISGR